MEKADCFITWRGNIDNLLLPSSIFSVMSKTSFQGGRNWILMNVSWWQIKNTTRYLHTCLIKWCHCFLGILIKRASQCYVVDINLPIAQMNELKAKWLHDVSVGILCVCPTHMSIQDLLCWFYWNGKPY